MITKRYLLLLGLFGWSYAAVAATTVKLSTVAQLAPAGHSIGTITLTDTEYGLLIEPDVTGLTPGIHGFHIHETPSCDNYGLAAAGDYDPDNTEKHLGPYNNAGHLGDLPALTADSDGKASLAIMAPRLTVEKISKRAMIIHLGGDNYSDTPEKMGGGGDRVACGVIP